MGFKRVSEAVIRRLPRYYRHLTMLETQGVERISSERLARQMNLNASQVRQDFNCFGGFGQQGYGYNVSNLTGEIKRIMGIDRKHTIIIVGAGNIGHALTNFPGFAETGFEVKALFDVNEDLIGTEIKGHPVLDVKDMDEYIRENQIDPPQRRAGDCGQDVRSGHTRHMELCAAGYHNIRTDRKRSPERESEHAFIQDRAWAAGLKNNVFFYQEVNLYEIPLHRLRLHSRRQRAAGILPAVQGPCGQVRSR